MPPALAELPSIGWSGALINSLSGGLVSEALWLLTEARDGKNHMHMTVTTTCTCRLQSSMAEMSQGIRIPENGYSETSIAFMDKVMEISGLGDKTFLPDGRQLSQEPLLALARPGQYSGT